MLLSPLHIIDYLKKILKNISVSFITPNFRISMLTFILVLCVHGWSTAQSHDHDQNMSKSAHHLDTPRGFTESLSKGPLISSVLSDLLGTVAFRSGAYESALRFYLLEIELLGQTDNQEQLGTAYYNVGQAYYMLKMYDKARDYFLEAAHDYILVSHHVMTGNAYRRAGDAARGANECAMAMFLWSIASHFYQRANQDFKIPRCEIPFIEITNASMVSSHVLGVQVLVGFPEDISPEESRYVELSTRINGQSVREIINITDSIIPGEAETASMLYIDLLNTKDDHDHVVSIQRFQQETSFRLKALAWTPSSGRSEIAEMDVNIRLPVIIIHGAIKNIFEEIFSLSIYESLIRFLMNNGYSNDISTYRTIWGPPTVMFSYQEETPTRAAAKLNTWINEALKSTYADKVNIIGHSLGGLLGRYYVTEFDSTRVNKVILIGTPNKGSTVFYQSAFSITKSSVENALKTSDNLPNLLTWLPPTYPCLFDDKTNEELLLPVPNLFYESGYDKPSPPGVNYYSIYNVQLQTPFELLVNPSSTDEWYEYAGIKSFGSGDHTVLVESAITDSINMSVFTETAHPFLPSDDKVQTAVLEALTTSESFFFEGERIGDARTSFLKP